MTESPQKKKKLTQTFPEYLVEHISSVYLPIKDALQNRSVSKIFSEGTGIRSRDLDFSGIYSRRRFQSEVVGIVDNTFANHKGSEIKRFVLLLNHFGVHDKIISWINTCIGKNIQELVLDFSKSRKTVELPIDFSAIETLTALTLKWCKFDIPGNDLKGLKLLRTLSLMRTEVTMDMVDAIFRNCIYLESLELIHCRMYGILYIRARKHKGFKSLSVCSMPNLLDIYLDAPTLECYKYDGYARIVNFSRVVALKEATLHYKRSYDWHRYDPSNMVLANIEAYTGVYVLSTTNIFLEALSDRCIDGAMRKPLLWFWDLREFEIVFKAPTTCTLYNIAEFMLCCPNIQHLVIDVNDFTFEPGMLWEVHHKQKIDNHNYELRSIKFVDINGYKNHDHELDIVEFFVKNAPALETLKLRPPQNPKVKRYEADARRVDHIKRISPKDGLVQFPQE